jgi:hypothetical protein
VMADHPSPQATIRKANVPVERPQFFRAKRSASFPGK